MAFADPSTYSGNNGDGSILGRFVEKEYGHIFEFSKNPDLTLFPKAHGGKNVEYPHLVWVGGKGSGRPHRWARVGKTVVHIVTDETTEGYVIEKWNIKEHCLYK